MISKTVREFVKLAYAIVEIIIRIIWGSFTFSIYVASAILSLAAALVSAIPLVFIGLLLFIFFSMAL